MPYHAWRVAASRCHCPGLNGRAKDRRAVVSSEMDLQPESRPTGMTRRQMLKKSAIAGGAVAWAVPTVEFVGTRVASAATTSGPSTSNQCSVTFKKISSFIPSSGTTTVKVTFLLFTGSQYVETLSIPHTQRSGAVFSSTTDSGANLIFTINAAGTRLSTTVPSGEIEIAVTIGATTNTSACGNNNPFVIIAGAA